MKKFVFSVALITTLSACGAMGGGTRILSANEAGISFQTAANKVSGTEKAAREHCQARGRTAVLDRVTPVGNNANVSYFCR